MGSADMDELNANKTDDENTTLDLPFGLRCRIRGARHCRCHSLLQPQRQIETMFASFVLLLLVFEHLIDDLKVRSKVDHYGRDQNRRRRDTYRE